MVHIFAEDQHIKNDRLPSSDGGNVKTYSAIGGSVNVKNAVTN